MGVDIYSGRGVVCTLDEFLKVVDGKNKADVVSVCHTYHQEIVKEAEQHPDDEWKKELSDSFKALRKLKKTMNLDEVRVIIASTVNVHGEPSKYGGCYVEEPEYVQDLFEKILDVSGHDLPYIQEVTAWGSGRYNGHSVPKGVACVVFDSECCFQKPRLSKHGKAVEKLLGHCDETEWTEYSV